MSDTRTDEPKARKRRRNGEKNLLKRNGWYYFRQMINGQPVTKALGTKDPVKAKADRDKLLREAKGAARLAAVESVRPAVAATLGEIEDAYVERWHIPDNRQTRKANMNALMNLARRGLKLPSTKEIRDVRLDAVTPAVIIAGRQDLVDRAEEDDEEERANAKAAANSLWRKAKAVFTHEDAFHGMHLGAGVEALRKVKHLKVILKTYFHPLNKEDGEKLLDALAKLRAENPHLYLAASLMLYCGCRNQEAGNAQREWIVKEKDGSHWLDITRRSYFKPKAGLRMVQIPPPLATELLELGGDPWLCTPGMTPSDRLDFVLRDLNDWVRSVLPERTAYDLRKQFGSCIAEAEGIWAAQTALGHASITTTQRWYARKVRSVAPVRLVFADKGAGPAAPAEPCAEAAMI